MSLRFRMSPAALDMLGASALGLAVSLIRVGDFRVRLANTHADDGPVFYAQFLRDPGRFAGDVITAVAPINARVSLPNWSAALLSRVGVPAEWSAWLLVHLQSVLLLMAILALARVAGLSRRHSWIAVALTLAADPTSWNLANYHSLLTVPYPGQLVLPLLLLAFAAAIAGRTVATGIVLGTAALVHPSLTLYAVPVLLLGWAYQPAPGTPWVGRRIAVLAAATGLAVLPAILVARAVVTDTMPAAALLEGMRTNRHMHPWTYLPDWTRGATLYLLVLGWTAAALYVRPAVAPAYRRLLAASLAVAAGAGLLHVLAWHIGFVQGLQLIPLRASVLPAVVAVPLLARDIGTRLESGGRTARGLAAASAMLLAIYQSMIAVIAVGPMLVRGERGGGRRSPLAVAMAAALLVAMAWLLRVPATGGVIPPSSLVYVAASVALAAVFAVFPLGGGAARSAVLVTLLIAVAMRFASIAGKETATAMARSNLAAQQWAGAHTAPSSRFMIADLPWRTVSGRPAAEALALRWYVYSRSAAGRRHDDVVLAALGLTERSAGLATVEFERAQREAYARLDVGGLCRLAVLLEADFIVRPSVPELQLPVAWSDGTLTIYRREALSGAPGSTACGS